MRRIAVLPLPATLALAGAILAACVGPIEPVSPSKPANTAPVTAFDGQYVGTMTVTGSASGFDASICTTSPAFNVQIIGGKFTYGMVTGVQAGQRTITYPATVNPDGTFRADIDTGYMAGTITGGMMKGEIAGSICYFAFTARKA